MTRRKIPGSFLLGAASSLAFAGALAARQAPAPPQQGQAGSYRESSRVSVVEVPVQATGHNGKPMAGLRLQDFELEEDGRPQAITAMDVVSLNHAGPVAGAAETPAAGRRHFLFLFDFTFATANEIARSRDAAVAFVGKGMLAEDLAGVATVSAEAGMRLELTFTPDRRQIVDALRRVGLPTGIDRSRDPLAFAFSEPGDPRLVLQEGYASKPLVVDANSTQKVLAAVGQRVADDYMVTRVVRHLTDLGGLARDLDLVDGRKIVLYFSEGFDSRLIFGSMAHEKSAEQTAADNDAMMSGASWSIDVDRRYANSPMQKQLSDTEELLRRSDCTVYPIDIAGLRDGAEGSIGQGDRGQDFLFALAQGTGGELIRNANDLQAQIARVAEKTSLTYILSYRSSVPEDGKYHRLRVRTRARGVRVSSRAGFYARKSYGGLSPLQRLFAASNVIANEKEGGDFPLEVLTLGLSQGAIARAPILIAIPAQALQGRDASGRSPLEIYAYAFDESGEVLDYFARNASIDSAAAQASPSGLIYYGTCHLLPGRYRVRVYVRNSVDGRFGFRAAPLEVPDFAARKLVALPPLFFGRETGELRLKDRSSVGGGEDPFTVGTAAFVPQIAPRVEPGKQSHVCLMIYRSDLKGSAPNLNLDVEVSDSDGRQFPAPAVSVAARTEPTPEGLVKLLLDFSVGDLPPGRYLLRVRFRDRIDPTIHAVTESAFQITS